MSSPATRHVVIVGSGPTGATYARRLLQGTNHVSVTVIEAGPVLTDPAGMNVRNVADPDAQLAAKLASQGPDVDAAGVKGIPVGTVVEGTVTARQGTHLIGRAADGSSGMPAAAGSTCVGGQGAHWTCATPRPSGSERIDFIDSAEWGRHIAEAEFLLHTTQAPFRGATQAEAILGIVRDEFSDDGFQVRPLPVAGDTQTDGSIRWAGTDVVLGDLARSGADAGGRFTLRSRTLCTRVVVEDGAVTGVVVQDQESGDEEILAADAVVVAADALRTPQLLWASGIRPPALGRYLTEHPLLFGVVAVRDGVLPPRTEGAAPIDPVSAAVSIGYVEDVHPFHAQLLYSPVCPVPLPDGHPQADNKAGYVGIGWGVRKWPRAEDRLEFKDDEPEASGLPGVRISYALTEREEAELERARGVQVRAAAALGEFIDGMPVVMPAGSSLHYMGTVRMGPEDDGTNVCDSYSRVRGIGNLWLAGNGLIPTANACNPTLTSVALAVRGCDALIKELNRESDS
jgi:choline dehydrogenase-like flavoprotein